LSIHPHDLFKNEMSKTTEEEEEDENHLMFSQFDNEGIPTHLFNGDEVSKVY